MVYNFWIGRNAGSNVQSGSCSTTLGIMAMFTSQDFVQRLSRHQAQRGLVVVGIIFALALLIGPVVMNLENHEWRDGCLLGLLLIAPLLMLATDRLVSAFLCRKQGLVCAACGGLLQTPRIARTGKCPRCQADVIRDA